MNQTSLSIKYYAMGRVTTGLGCGTRGGHIPTHSMAHIPITQWAQGLFLWR